MITINTQLLVNDLLYFREFDRIKEPAPKILYYPTYTIEEVVEWVKIHGITTPLEFSVFEDSALLTDGNHRILAASILNIDKVPVRISIFESMDELNTIFFEHTIKKFKKFYHKKNILNEQ